MIADTPMPADRTSFNAALAVLHAEHATMRHLAACALRGPGFSTDDTLSLADAMLAHERTEAGLFALPFLTRTPPAVTASAARARQRCQEYLSGDFRLPEADAAGLFVEALLAHLTAEETWLAEEKAAKNERLWTAI
jgi:hypothetical protein